MLKKSFCNASSDKFSSTSLSQFAQYKPPIMVKVLLCGRVRDAVQWRTVFERVQKLNAAAAKSNAPLFTLLLVVGGALPAALDALPAPLPTFVLSPSEASEPMRTAPEQVAENLFALRGHGIVAVRVLYSSLRCRQLHD